MKFKRIIALGICVFLIQSVVINALPLVKKLNNQTVRPGMSMTPGTSITPYYNTANWAGTLFPAGIFRDALLKEMGIQIGKNAVDLTVLDVLEFRGNLDLRDKGITNIDGIIHIKRANKIDLSNTLNADGTFASATPNRITDIDRNLRTGNPISPNAPNLGGNGDNELLSVGTLNFSGNSINKTVSHLSRGISNLILDNQIYHLSAPINLLAGTSSNISLKVPYAKVRHVEITPQSPNPIYRNYDLKPYGKITGGYVGEVQNPLTYTHDPINNMLSVEMVANQSGTIKINTLFDVNIIYYRGTALSGNARGAGMNGSMFQDIKVYHPINIKTDDVAATVFLTGVEKTLTTSDGTTHNGTPVLTGVSNGFGDIDSRPVINVVGGGSITEIMISVGGTVHTFSSVADANAFLSAGVTGETEIVVKARPKGRIMNMDSYATGFVGMSGDNSTSSTGEHFLGNPATFSFEPNPFYVADKLYIGTEGAIPNTLLIDEIDRLSLPYNYSVNWNGKTVNGTVYETNGSNVDKHLTATASTSFPSVGTVFGVKFKPTIVTKPSVGGTTTIVGGYPTQTYDSTKKLVERFAKTSSFAITPNVGWYLNHINLSSYDLAQSLLQITGGNVSADVIAHGQSFHLTGAINQTGNTSTLTFDNLGIPLDLKANFLPTIKVSLLGGLGGNLTIDKEINGRYATNQFSIQAQKGWYPKIAISSMNGTPTYVTIANGTLETDLFVDGKMHKITGTITTSADGLQVILDPYNIPLDIEVSLHTSISAHNFTNKYGGDDGGTLTITGAVPSISNRYDTDKIILKPTLNWKVDEQSFIISPVGEMITNPTKFVFDKTKNTLSAKIVMGGKTYDIIAKQTYDSTLGEVTITFDSVPIPLDIGIEFKPIVKSYNLNDVKESASVVSSEKEKTTEILLKINNGWLLDKLFVSPSKTTRNPQEKQELLIDEKGNVSATVISDGKSHTITGLFDEKSGIISINRTLFPVDIGASFKATTSSKNLTHDNLGGTLTLGGETVDAQTKRYLDDTTIATLENGWQTIHYFIANMGELSTAPQKINVQEDGTFSVDLLAYNKMHTLKGNVETQNEKVIIKLDNVIVPVDIGFQFTPTITMLNLTPNNAGTTIEVAQEVSVQKTDRHLSTQVSWKAQDGWLVGTKSLKIAPINGLFENKVATLKVDEKTGKASANISFEGKSYPITGTIKTDDTGKTTLQLEELPCPVDIGIVVQPSFLVTNLTKNSAGGTITYMDVVVETTTQRGIENTITFESSKNWNMSATDIVVAPMGNLNVKSKPFTINKRTGEARTVLTVDGRKYEIEAMIHIKKNNRLFIKRNQVTFELISSEIPIDIGVIFSPNKGEIPNNSTSSQSQSQSQSSSLTSSSSSSIQPIKAPANTGA